MELDGDGSSLRREARLDFVCLEVGLIRGNFLVRDDGTANPTGRGSVEWGREDGSGGEGDEENRLEHCD